MNDCLVTKLKGAISGGSFNKLGEVTIKIAPNTEGSEHFAYIYTLCDKATKLTLDEGAYFCTSLTDDTPLNGTKGASREVTVPMDTKSFYYVYFDEEYANIKISDKYSWHGFARNSSTVGSSKKTWYVKYDLANIKYLTKMEAFTAPLTSPITNPQDLVGKKVVSADGYIEGNCDGFTFGSETSFIASIRLTNISGAISFVKNSSLEISMEGDYTCSVSNNNAKEAQLYLHSTGVTGDIGTWTKAPSYGNLGNASNYCSVVCNSAPNIASSDRGNTLYIYSNSITEAMLSNLVTNLIVTAQLRVFSSQLDASVIAEDSTIMGKIDAIKEAGCSVYINGTKM